MILAGWVVVGALGACGPSVGGSCQTRTFSCASETTAYECRDEIWVEIPCRGTGGCVVEEGRVHCDMTLNQPGDLCPVHAEGQGTCKTPELNAVLECRDGVLVQTRSCSDCFGSGQTLVCEP